MKRTFSFADYAVQIVLIFLSPLTFFALIPMAVFYVIVALAFGAVVDKSEILAFASPVLMYFAGSFLIGRFACGARRGEPAAGVILNGSTVGEALHFALRHLLLTVAWELPILLLICCQGTEERVDRQMRRLFFLRFHPR